MNSPPSRQRQCNLDRLLRPRHIAYIGGSQVSGALALSQRAGFKGELWVVNPNSAEIGGLTTYASIEALPQAPDAALVALTAQNSIQAVSTLARAGAGGAVCMAAGFAEFGESGADLQQQLREAAGDLAVIGPNCMGIINLFEGAAIWGAGGQIDNPGNNGAAIISQSGAFLYGITNVERGFPLGYAISTGNQAVTDMADCIESVIADERVRAIGVYIEGLDNGAALGNACWHALEKGVPVIALKGGDTAGAATVAISHTNAMIVERDLWHAFSERYGVIGVSSPKAMVEALKLLTIGGVPRGNRVSTISFSGGLNGLIVSQAPEFGLKLNQPVTAGVERMRALLPETIRVANPLDLNLPWSSKSGMSLRDGEQIAECLSCFADQVADQAVMFLDVPRPDGQGSDTDWYPSMEAMASVHQALNIPCSVAGILPEGLDVELRNHLMRLGVAPLLGFRDAMEALSVAARAGIAQHEKAAATKPGALLTDMDGTEACMRMLDEAESKTALTRYGLSISEFRVCARDQVATAAAEIGFPVALKLISNEISHKAKVGGVALALDSGTALANALDRMVKSVKESTGRQIDSFLVESMIHAAAAEYIIGIKRQAALGLALMIGRGGVDVEALDSHSTVLLPLVEADLVKAMTSIGLNQDSLGHDAMLTAVRAVAAYALDHKDRLQTLDVNPVIVTTSGDAIAADALIVLSEEN
jgi:acyl-CoA synthetase (NDP forming)